MSQDLEQTVLEIVESEKEKKKKSISLDSNEDLSLENLNELVKQLESLKESLEKDSELFSESDFLLKLSLKNLITSALSLIPEYLNLTYRILEVKKVVQERGVYDELSLVKAQEVLNTLYSERIKLKTEISKILKDVSKFLLDKNKIEIQKEKREKETIDKELKELFQD